MNTGRDSMQLYAATAVIRISKFY